MPPDAKKPPPEKNSDVRKEGREDGMNKYAFVVTGKKGPLINFVL